METFIATNNMSEPLSISLLPIREAYEWKREGGLSTIPQVSLLPIREAYEWKRCLSHLPARRPQLASNS